jgi:hypothetical protein
MTDLVTRLLDILDLEQLELNLFRGRSPATSWQRVFGGQTIAQALVAAQRTVELGRNVHSLHGYFLRPRRSGGAGALRGGPQYATAVQLHHTPRRRRPARQGDLLALEPSFQRE